MGRALLSHRAEEDHAREEPEELEEGDDEARGADDVESGDEIAQDGGGAALFVPLVLVAALGVQAAAVALAFYAARVGDAVFCGPGVDLVPVRVVADAAAVELKVFGFFQAITGFTQLFELVQSFGFYTRKVETNLVIVSSSEF